MDPLSVTASILAILGAGGKIGKGLKKVVHLKDAPDALLALNNEVADLKLVVADIDDHLRALEEVSDSAPPKSVTSALEKVKSTTLELERYIAYDLTTVDGKTKDLRVDRSKWMRAEVVLSNLREAIRGDRVALGSGLNLIALITAKDGVRLTKKVYCSLEAVHNSILDSRDALKNESESQSIPKLCDADHQQQPSPHPSTVGCHNTFDLHERISSDTRGLRKNNGTQSLLKYTKGPEFLLRVLRVRSSYDSIVQVMMKWSDNKALLNEVKRQLDAGEASVLDLFEDVDKSLVQLAICFMLWDVVHLLICYGADMTYESSCGRIPWFELWEWRWARRRIPARTYQALVETCQFPRQIDILRVPPLHRAYFRSGGLSFESSLLSTSRADVDGEDFQGRTVLSWAAIKSDARSILRLLRCGADPNQVDLHGDTPLHHAVSARNTECIEILLASKADPNANNDTNCRPLHAVKDNPDVERQIGSLVNYGAKINEQDDVGRTPLHFAAMFAAPSVCKALLIYGADINLHCNGRETPVFTAIKRRTACNLRVFLQNKKLDWTIATNRGEGLLHYVAIDGWTCMELARWRRDCQGEWSKTLSMPPDRDPIAWFEAFGNLILDIRIRHKRVRMSKDDNKGPESSGTRAEINHDEIADSDNAKNDGYDDNDNEEEQWEDAHEGL
ncbi:uncharacterized protein KY384_005787 [Bacidia gigantensis]|uniref:uncharacterized protein n=1 Tax=Bacidia gigantensis TaxID=2732470 RepID=UPI001D04264E|nr:uncharacterized protein KY384_005787 [Bacidia gigantensis]KAG8529152.1 hypothetical protein KY384_005787 [Bacidia gigantensis]